MRQFRSRFFSSHSNSRMSAKIASKSPSVMIAATEEIIEVFSGRFPPDGRDIGP
jgi:hypothetical protein